MFDENILKIYL